MSQIGQNWLLHRNGGTYAAPTWSSVGRAKDVNLPLSKATADVSRKESSWKLVIGALKEGKLSFGYQYRARSAGTDAHLEAFLDSFLTDTPIELAVTDAAMSEDHWGIKAHFVCTSFPINQPLADGVTLDLEFEITDAEDSSGNLIEPEVISG